MSPSVQNPQPTGPGTASTRLADRQYVSQFSEDTVGLTINVGGVLTDVDGQAMTVSMADANANPIFTGRSATRAAVGTYQYTFTQTDVENPGIYTMTWSYSLSSVPDEYQTYIEVGSVAPAYDVLDSNSKLVIEGVWERFADLFDSSSGGPHLQFYYQTAFDRGRLAQLMQIALRKLNISQQPWMNFQMPTPQNPTAVANFPFTDWGGLLDQALYVETIRHLIRSYAEQPLPEGIPSGRMDRRDYMMRWQIVLDDEKAELKKMQDVFKIRNMGLGMPNVLVSGGVFGSYGPTRLAGSAIARPQYWARFY